MSTPITMTAAQILAKQLPPLTWIVPGLIPEGGLLLAGRPKGGKSWLALQLALSLAENAPVWGVKCPPAECLYIALEDGPRRLKARLTTLCGSDNLRPRGLHLAVEWPSLAAECIPHLEGWLDKHPAVRLIIIDTLTRIRDRALPRHQKGSLYESDYDAVAPFAALGRLRKLCVCLICHTRKPGRDEDEDPFDSISGTLGLTGATDTIAVLKRPVHSADAKLEVRGRDLEDQTIRLTWSAEHCLWSRQQNGETPTQTRYLTALKAAKGPLSPLEVANVLQVSHDAAKQQLARMRQDGLVKASAGRYSIWS